jgi:hypothetical protein
MVEVKETAKIGLSADAAWRRIGSFGSVGEWHPMLAKVDSEGDTPGSRCHVKTTEGGRQVERLEAFDPANHVYRYVIDETALPVCDYHAELRIDGDGDNASTIIWSAQFEVASDDKHQGIDAVRQFLKAGLDDLGKRYPPDRSDGE